MIMKSIGKLLKSSSVDSELLITLNDGMLKRIQDDLFAMLKDIKTVCDKHDIKWGLIAGSLLGAIRYKDFIPWDDDVDIYMLRDEYNKFEHIFDLELGKKYILRKPGDKDYIFHFPQIHKKNTRLQLLESRENDDSGLFIDLFIYDNVSNSTVIKSIHGLICTAFLFVDSVLRMKICENNILRYCRVEEVISALKKRTRWALLFNFFSLETWLKATDNVFKIVRKKGKYLVNPSGAKHYFGEIYFSKELEDVIEIEFRDVKLPVPTGYDYYLRIRYGEAYIVPPKDSEKEMHKYIRVQL